MAVSRPADQLPQELLADIFLLLAKDSTIHPTFISKISHVSAHWRRVALSTPSLWARIILAFPLSALQLSYASTCLIRSGVYPLDILWDLRDPSWDWDEEAHKVGWKEMEHVMRLFLPHFARWRSLELLTDNWAPIFTFLWYTKDVQPGAMLESLSLSRCNAYFAIPGQEFQPYPLRQPIQLFSGTTLPRLRKVSLVGTHIDWNQPCVLRQLTQLDLKYLASDVTPTFEQFRAITDACPELRKLSIYGRGPDINSDTPPTTQLSLPNLQTFSFGFIDTNYAIQLISRLSIPRLQTLVLEDMSKGLGCSAVDATPLLSWLTSSLIGHHGHPSISNVQSLELHGLQSTRCQFNSFFGALSSITHLSLIDMPEDALSLLISKNTADEPQLRAAPLFPALRCLRCQDVDPDALIEVVSSRIHDHRGSPRPLQEISLKFVRCSPPPVEASLYARLVEVGIEIMEDT